MKGYCSKSAVCPMYKQEYRDRCSICCEGFSRETRIHTFFSSKDELLKHEKRYCNDIKGYGLCPVYLMASRKYEMP